MSALAPNRRPPAFAPSLAFPSNAGSRRAPSGPRLSEIIEALSHALDMTEGQPPGHCIRSAFIGTRIGAAIGLDEAALHDLRYTLLLKDLGCSSNAARLCQLYLTDDLGFKQAFKRIDDGLPEVLRFVIGHTGLKSGLAERLRAIVHIVRNGGEIAQELIETRCGRGAAIARKLRFSEAVAEGVASLDEHWDGGGKPAKLTGEAIPLFSRIALLAQVVDVVHQGGGRAAALAEAARRTGRWFDPALALAFARIAAEPAFWERLEGPQDGLLERFDEGDARPDEDYLDDIAEAFAEIVDSKSPYTSGHCQRVAAVTDLIGESLGLDAAKRRWMKRAALLHDVGKLGVSNTILDKPGKLDEAEWMEMRRHASHSRTILARIPAFAEIAAVGGAHHERLDGRGYPDGLKGEAISFETRIVTVADIFDALTADRPYRAAMPVSQALAIMERDVGTAIDATCFAALRRALGELAPDLVPVAATVAPIVRLAPHVTPVLA